MERLLTVPSFVGIDVSKDRLDVHIRPSGQTVAAQRNDTGVEQLVGELRQLSPALIVLEATGGFETTVAAALAGAHLPASEHRQGKSHSVDTLSEAVGDSRRWDRPLRARSRNEQGNWLAARDEPGTGGARE